VRNAVGLSHVDARRSGEVEKTAPPDRICGVVVSRSASEVRLASLQTCGDGVGRRQQTPAERIAVNVRRPRGTARLWSNTPETEEIMLNQEGRPFFLTKLALFTGCF